MNVTRMIAALATALSLSVGVAHADPVPGTPSPTPILKAKKCWDGPRVGPGGGWGSAGIPVYPPPCPPKAPR